MSQFLLEDPLQGGQFLFGLHGYSDGGPFAFAAGSRSLDVTVFIQGVASSYGLGFFFNGRLLLKKAVGEKGGEKERIEREEQRFIRSGRVACPAAIGLV